MAKRYMAVRFGAESYFGLIGEEVKGGIRIVEKRRVDVNQQNLSENGFDRDALKLLFNDANIQEFVVAIPHYDVFTGIVEFPLTDRKKIEGALSFELESETMENPETLISDYRIINNAEGRTQIAYYASKKETIKTLLSELSMIGVDPSYLVAYQNLYSGFYKYVFDKNSPKGVKTILDFSDNILSLSFLDSEGFVFGRALKVLDLNEDISVIKNFITSTIQYYKMRAHREIVSTYIIASEEVSDFFYNLLNSEIKLNPLSKLSVKDSDSNDIETEFVIPYASLVARIELTKKQLINFRKGEFIYKGEYEFLKKQLIKYGIAVAFIIIFTIVLTIYKFRMISKYDEMLNNSLAEVTKQILGKPYDNFTTALAVIKSKTEPKNLSIPQVSAFDYFMSFSDSFPSEVDVNIRTIEIGDKKIRMEGETDSFESVDRVVNALKKNNCFKEITKGKVKKSPDGKKIDFDLAITPSC